MDLPPALFKSGDAGIQFKVLDDTDHTQVYVGTFLGFMMDTMGHAIPGLMFLIEEDGKEYTMMVTIGALLWMKIPADKEAVKQTLAAAEKMGTAFLAPDGKAKPPGYS